ncbi:MAG: CoA-binding protein [Haloarculaceae archaeon]
MTLDSVLRDALAQDVIAVVGCSGTAGKDAHEVPKYLVRHGYEVIPVNPVRDEVLDRPAYDSLAEVEADVDVVNVFRPSDEVAGIVDQAVDRDDVSFLWTQLDVRDDEAAARAEDAGIDVVQDRCIKVEHRRLQ